MSTFPGEVHLANLPVNALQLDSTGNNLYAGTDIGVYQTSTALAAAWVRFGTGLPYVQVDDLDLKTYTTGTFLAAATHGRGVWVVDPPAGGNPTENPNGARRGEFPASLPDLVFAAGFPSSFDSAFDLRELVLALVDSPPTPFFDSLWGSVPSGGPTNFGSGSTLDPLLQFPGRPSPLVPWDQPFTQVPDDATMRDDALSFWADQPVNLDDSLREALARV